jgi:hypothetical protein
LGMLGIRASWVGAPHVVASRYAHARPLSVDPTRVLALGAYASVGALLVVTRAVGIDRSYWQDEIVTVRDFVRAGPFEILAGAYVPNNHELFSLLGWATSSLVGESEIAMRVWSVAPFVLGVALVTAWLHRRVGALSGVLFLILCTASPLLLDITRQARGYGLAFLAMSVLVVAALEARRTASTAAVAAVGAAAIVGSWTLPNFTIAALATGAVLLLEPALRRRVATTLGICVVGILAFYAPHFDDLRVHSHQAYGYPVEPAWILTAPIDQILVPGLAWIDGRVVDPGVVWLPVVIALALLAGSSPLLRDRTTAAILGTGVIATVIVLWIAGAGVAPRFLSYLLVPLFMLLATGVAAVATRDPRPPLVRTLVSVGTMVLVAAAFATAAKDVFGLPREAHKEAAAVISADTPVFAATAYPDNVAFYLGRQPSPVSADTCRASTEVAVVEQPWGVRPLDLPCFSRPGTRMYRFEQYTRGDGINVWFVPPAMRTAS